MTTMTIMATLPTLIAVIAVIFVFLGLRMVAVRLMLVYVRGWFSRVMGMFDGCCGNWLLMVLMMLMIVFVHGIHLVKQA
jgi:hypothetical protein